MTDKNSKGMGYVPQLALFLGLTGAGLILSLLFSVAIWLMMTGGAMPSKIEQMLQPKYYSVNMILQAVTTFFIFFFPVYIFARVCYYNANRFLGFNLRVNYKQLLLVAGILVLTFPLSGLLGELTGLLPVPESWAIKFKAMEATREAQEATLININSFSKYLISLFIIALLPAIFEESFFRAGMQGILTRWFNGPWLGIILTSLIFSAIHLSFYGFVVRFALGVILGLIYFYSSSLWLSILFHFLFNGLQVTALYVMNGPGIRQAKDLEKTFPIWTGMVALLVLLLLFREYKRISLIQRSRYAEEEVPESDFHDWATNRNLNAF